MAGTCLIYFAETSVLNLVVKRHNLAKKYCVFKTRTFWCHQKRRYTWVGPPDSIKGLLTHWDRCRNRMLQHLLTSYGKYDDMTLSKSLSQTIVCWKDGISRTVQWHQRGNCIASHDIASFFKNTCGFSEESTAEFMKLKS